MCCGQRSVNVVEFTSQNAVVYPSGAYDLFDIVYSADSESGDRLFVMFESRNIIYLTVWTTTPCSPVKRPDGPWEPPWLRCRHYVNYRKYY